MTPHTWVDEDGTGYAVDADMLNDGDEVKEAMGREILRLAEELRRTQQEVLRFRARDALAALDRIEDFALLDPEVLDSEG